MVTQANRSGLAVAVPVALCIKCHLGFKFLSIPIETESVSFDVELILERKVK